MGIMNYLYNYTFVYKSMLVLFMTGKEIYQYKVKGIKNILM